MAPGSFSVPPLIVKVDEVVNADAIESVPPLIVNGSVDVRLLIVSVIAIGVNDIGRCVDGDIVARAGQAVGAPVPGRVPVVVVGIARPDNAGQQGPFLHPLQARPARPGP